MLSLVKEDTFYMKEDSFPQFREIFSDLAREQDFPIYWFNEDNSGEIEINIHSSFAEDLEELITDNVYPDYNKDLSALVDLVNTYGNLTSFYYK